RGDRVEHRVGGLPVGTGRRTHAQGFLRRIIMATAAKVGTNFTGVQMSPKDTKSLLDAVNEIHPDVPGDSRGIMAERTMRGEEAERVGSVPVPGSAKGMLKTTFDMAMGRSPEILIDKL